MSNIVLIQREPNESLSYEGKLIYRHCVMERIKVIFYSLDDVITGKTSFDESILVVGTVEAISSVLKSMSLPIPSPNYYPTCLNKFLHRNVQLTTVADVRGELLNEREIFAKSLDWKKITGRVFVPKTGWDELENLPADTPMWISEPVTFLAEFRIYVLDTKILAVANYWGDVEAEIDMDVVQRAVEVLAQDPETPKTYAIDWGLLTAGHTVLVELNDGWSIGAYEGIGAKDYFNFLASRWHSLNGR